MKCCEKNIIFLKDFIYLFLERGEGREKERERHQCVIASCMPLACNPGLCTDWESDWQPLGMQAGTQSTEPHQPGQNIIFYKTDYFLSFTLSSTKWCGRQQTEMSCWLITRPLYIAIMKIQEVTYGQMSGHNIRII